MRFASKCAETAQQLNGKRNRMDWVKCDLKFIPLWGDNHQVLRQHSGQSSEWFAEKCAEIAWPIRCQETVGFKGGGGGGGAIKSWSDPGGPITKSPNVCWRQWDQQVGNALNGAWSKVNHAWDVPWWMHPTSLKSSRWAICSQICGKYSKNQRPGNGGNSRNAFIHVVCKMSAICSDLLLNGHLMTLDLKYFSWYVGQEASFCEFNMLSKEMRASRYLKCGNTNYQSHAIWYKGYICMLKIRARLNRYAGRISAHIMNTQNLPDIYKLCRA